MELDHIFICTHKGAPAADLLVELGLSEGSKNVHPGQGTANRRFFFHNAMLELLWLDDAEAAQSALTLPTGLHARCSLNDPGVSPFGICFRPSHPDECQAPFPAWHYRPEFFPHPLSVEVGEAPLREPMWFFLAFVTPREPAKSKEPLKHPVGFERLSNVVVSTVGTAGSFSEPARVADALGHLEVDAGAAPLIELEFDEGTAGKTHDFRPALPLIFRW